VQYLKQLQHEKTHCVSLMQCSSGT